MHSRSLPFAAEGRHEHVISEHPTHPAREPLSAHGAAAERAWEPEELREDVVGAPEPERGRTNVTAGEERGVPGARRRDLALEALLVVLVIGGALLGVTKDLFAR